MKTLKRTVLLSALILGLGIAGGTAHSNPAADGDGPGRRDRSGWNRQSELSRLESLLGLTVDQVARLQPILEATHAAMQEVRGQAKAGTLSADDARAKFKALHEQEKAKILPLLTPEQQAKFAQPRDHH